MGIQKKDREYERFLDQISDFIFVEDKPERADIIFVPGNGFPQMSIEAARLWKEGMAPWILPSGKYSIGKGAFTGVQAMKEKYQGPYQTEWEFMKDVLLKEGVPEKGNYLLQSPACQKMQAVLSVFISTDNLSHLPFGCGNQPGKLV